jgi:hypothetical protein
MGYSKDWEETGTNPDKVKAKYKKNKEKITPILYELAKSIFKDGERTGIADMCLSSKHPLSKYSITHYDVVWNLAPVSAILRIYTAPAFGAVIDKDVTLIDTLVARFKSGEQQ